MNDNEIKLLETCAYLSNKVYDQDDTKIITFEWDAQCMIEKSHNDELYIAFRGTSSIQDMLQDLKISRLEPKFLPACKVHQGALEQYVAIRPHLLSLFKTNRKIYFTGHSLGAMIATIASLDYGYNYTGEVYCVTFGSPRVGDKTFCTYFKRYVKNSYRCVFNNDIISYTPSCLRFRHIDKLVICKNKSLKMKKRQFSCWMSINDHSMQNYINSIQNYSKCTLEQHNDIVMYPLD